MNKFIKVLGILTIALVITGCGCTKQTDQNNNDEDNIKISSEGIDSYNLDLKITGTNIGKSFDNTVTVTSMDDQNYKITYEDKNIGAGAGGDIALDPNANQTVIYVKNGKTYTINEEGKYVLNETSINYANPNVYLKVLDNITTIDKGTKTTINNVSYTFYNVKFKKASISDVVNDTALLDIKVTDDASGQVYLDKSNRVFRIIYKVTDATITATYSNINKKADIDFPEEI